MKSFVVVKKNRIIFTTTDVTREDRQKEYQEVQRALAERIGTEQRGQVYAVYTDTNNFNELVEAIKQLTGIQIKPVVTFSWDFEVVANDHIVKYYYVEGLDNYTNELIEGLDHYQIIKLIKKITKEQNKIFINTSDDGVGRQYTIARLNAHHGRAK